jgi:PST family polysaccharide transporter
MVKSDVDAIFVLQIQSICTLLGAFSQFLILYQKEKIIFSKWHEVWQEIKIGWHTFIYKSSSSILASMSVLILGFLASPLAVSYYVSAEKIIRAIIGLTQPVILASYPKFSQLALEDKSQSIH